MKTNGISGPPRNLRVVGKFEANNLEKLSGHLLSLSVKNPKGESPLEQLQPVHNDHLLHLPLTSTAGLLEIKRGPTR